MLSSSFGIHPNACRFHSRQHGGERQVDFFIKFGKILLFHFRAKQGREPQQKIGALARRARKRAVQMPQHRLRKRVVGRGRPQQIRIEHRRVPDSANAIWASGVVPGAGQQVE